MQMDSLLVSDKSDCLVEPDCFLPPCDIRWGRGAYATDNDVLCPLVNVAGMKLCPSLFEYAPSAKGALELLSRDPFKSNYEERKLEETPNSECFRSHIQTLENAKVLVPASWEVPHAIGNYMAALKDQTYARAIFDLRWTNERITVVDLAFHTLGTSELVRALIQLGNTA